MVTVMQVIPQPVVAFVIVLCLVHCQTIDFSNENKRKSNFLLVIYEHFKAAIGTLSHR